MYVRNINAEDERFKFFISKYLEGRGVKNPETVPYSELYKVIKGGIREYLRQQQLRKRSEK